MSNRFFEIKAGNFVASEKNKVNNVNLVIEKLSTTILNLFKAAVYLSLF